MSESDDPVYRHDAQRRALFFALRSRVLSECEMKQVEAFGDQLNIDPNVPYFYADKSAELNAALLQQFRLRRIAEEVRAKESPDKEP